MEDLDLFRALQGDGVNGLISLDQRQLFDPRERESLRNAGLHWIGTEMPEARGYEFSAAINMSLLNGLTVLLDEGFDSQPHQYFLASTKSSHRALVTKTAI
ncbi:hypothetical protein [Leucobacter chromiireducens]|uniref:hypothetical protein n=1 Tax=Leucobacter chromiireducens TaxID=283877 RepID=UPI000F62F90F